MKLKKTDEEFFKKIEFDEEILRKIKEAYLESVKDNKRRLKENLDNLLEKGRHFRKILEQYLKRKISTEEFAKFLKELSSLASSTEEIINDLRIYRLAVLVSKLKYKIHDFRWRRTIKSKGSRITEILNIPDTSKSKIEMVNAVGSKLLQYIEEIKKFKSDLMLNLPELEDTVSAVKTGADFLRRLIFLWEEWEKERQEILQR